MAYTIDPRRREFIVPERIVTFSNGGGSIIEMEALLNDDIAFCQICFSGSDAPYIVFDFGKEIHGGVSLEIHGVQPLMSTEITLCFGESVSEAMGHPNQDHTIHEMTVKIPMMSKQEFGQTGFRFLKITLNEKGSTIDLRNIAAVSLERPWEYRGNFHCSDPLLNDIWQIGARTVHLCCQDHILDGIKRDRLAWMGDIHPQIGVLAAVFGKVDIVKESLDYLCKLYPANTWMNNIPSYSLWWVITLWEWYYYTGDKAFLESNSTYLQALTERFSEMVNSDGILDLGEERYFLEWACAGDEMAISEGTYALMIWAMNDTKKIAEVLGLHELAVKSSEISAKLAKREQKPLNSKQVNSLRVLAGVADTVETNNNFLSQNMCDGISPWFALYILRAKAMAGDHQGCLKLIRDYWGGMLQLGATSFWEHFQIDWLENAGRIDEIVPAGKKDVHVECGDHCFKGLRHSLCHGWAGNPTAWLSEHVLGIKIIEPGCRTIRLEPKLGDLTEVEGAFPTPMGLLKVRHHVNSDGNIKSEYEAPEGVTIIQEKELNEC